MAKEILKEKLVKVLAERPAGLKEAAQWRRKNRAWLKKSFEIALNVLDVIEDKGWTQKRLAKEMGVSPQQVNKIVKGQENLSLSTIAKLESVLGINLVQVICYSRQEVSAVESTDIIVKATMDASSQISKRASIEDWVDTDYRPRKHKQKNPPELSFGLAA